MPLSDAVHFTTLKEMARSAAHYRHVVQHPRPDTAAFRFGRLVHQLVLEPEKPCHVFKGRRHGKAWEQWEADMHGLETFTLAEYNAAAPCAESVLSCPDAVAVLKGRREIKAEWRLDGRACAGRLDVLGDGYVTDLKTCRTADPRQFAAQALRYGYHAQLDWYLHAATLAELGAPQRAYIVAVESAPPYPVTVLELTTPALELGRRVWRAWWEQLRVCEDSGHWPGYVQGVVPLDVPDDDLVWGDEGDEAA